MFEKVNPSHPDKVADRIAGAIVDLAYKHTKNPHIAVEVLIGHSTAFLIIETDDYSMLKSEVKDIVIRLANIPKPKIKVLFVPQDKHLNDNQKESIRCGDNGIFKPVKMNHEEHILTEIAKAIYDKFPSDGKYIINDNNVTICQSYVGENKDIEDILDRFAINKSTINPLGPWTGGLDVDSGATNRKLGSDMGEGVTGGGLHGKDLSKADVTLNICAFLDQKEYCCSIGDEMVDGKPYSSYVSRAKEYIESIGGFEKFAEWGLIR